MSLGLKHPTFLLRVLGFAGPPAIGGKGGSGLAGEPPPPHHFALLLQRSKESIGELAPILEHVVMDFTLASPQHRGSLEDEDRAGAPAVADSPMNPDPHPEVAPAAPSAELNLGDLHALPLHELKERKKEARDQKRRLRHTLREFEERFERETGRKMQKEDRGPLEKDYNEYKHVKAKLRLLEALLSKHDS